MTYGLTVTSAALVDLAGALRWYREHAAPEQATRLADDYDATIERICEFPHAARAITGSTRRMPLRVFPYRLWYRCDDAKQVIEIVALVHNRQDWGQFASRLN